MATYLYETVDTSKPTEQFEIQQSMKDAALLVHPETGLAIRRVISGGFGLMKSGGTQAGGSGGAGAAAGRAPAPRCGTGCGCH